MYLWLWITLQGFASCKHAPIHEGLGCRAHHRDTSGVSDIYGFVFLRCSSVPVLSWLYPRWRTVPIQPAAHVRRLRVCGVSELHLCTEWIMCQPCDQTRPRWQIWLLENTSVQQEQERDQQQQQQGEHAEEWNSADYRTVEERMGAPSRVGLSDPSRHCIVIRAEHCIGDGMSLIEVTRSC